MIIRNSNNGHEFVYVFARQADAVNPLIMIVIYHHHCSFNCVSLPNGRVSAADATVSGLKGFSNGHFGVVVVVVVF